ncbi:MAG: LysM peptidoglycan-binding domain-containing protein, partial [Anaerolineales bacterium]
APNLLGASIQDGIPHDTAEVSPSLPAVQPTQCGSPPGWVGYIVQAGDTLWGISIRADESVEELRMANCLENASLIFIGQSLYVPNLLLDGAPTSTITSTPPAEIPTLSPTNTQKPTEEPSPIPSQPPLVPTLDPPRNTPTLAPTSIPSGEG